MFHNSQKDFMDSKMTTPKPIALTIEQQIFFVRGERVMVDTDLAALYAVQTKALIQAVKRNIDRFPKDFMFQLTLEEFEILRSQSVTSSWGGRRYKPYVFTEQGVAMLSSVLRSQRAVQVNIEIMRAFVHLRRMLDSHKDLRQKIESLEQKYNKQFKMVFDAIKQLMIPPELPKRPIGFAPWVENNKTKSRRKQPA